MPKTKKTKSKSCNRGYPCGHSCISRGFKCQKKIQGQASTYADWLKLQGDRLGDEFNKEAGARLSKEANQKVKITRTEKSLEESLFSKTFEMLDKGDEAILNSDRVMLKMAEDFLRLNIGNAEENKLEIANLKARIAEREKKINQRKDKTPKNQAVPFKRIDKTDKAISKLLNSRQSLADKIEKLESLTLDIANQIVPFRKKRSQDFSESTLFEQYYSLREQVVGAIAILETQLKAIANG